MNSWYERSGGYLVSVALHLLAFSALAVAMAKVVIPLPQEKEVQITMGVGGHYPGGGPGGAMVPNGNSNTPPPPNLSMAPIAATGNDEKKGLDPSKVNDQTRLSPHPKDGAAKNLAQAQATPQQEAPMPPLIKETPPPEITPEDTPPPKKEIAKAEPVDPLKLDPLPASPEGTMPKYSKTAKETDNEKLEKAWEQYKNIGATGNQQRSDLEQKINSEEVRVKGKNLLNTATAGGDTGAVRAFDFKNVPPEIMRDIMQRYDMRNVTEYIKDSDNYLNSTEMNGSTYHSTNQPGLYNVFEIGPAGNARMKTLESDALKANGFNPATDRLIKITFGVVNTEHGWDLGVTDLKAEKIGD